MDDFIDALKLEILSQYNDARTDPVAYSKTAGLPPRAVALLQKVAPVPPFGGISVELSEEAMNKARRRRCFRGSFFPHIVLRKRWASHAYPWLCGYS